MKVCVSLWYFVRFFLTSIAIRIEPNHVLEKQRYYQVCLPSLTLP